MDSGCFSSQKFNTSAPIFPVRCFPPFSKMAKKTMEIIPKVIVYNNLWHDVGAYHAVKKLSVPKGETSAKKWYFCSRKIIMNHIK